MPEPTTPDAETCRNCETPLSGAFCHACGQEQRIGMGFPALLKRFAASMATPGGRFFETLTGLVASPGTLTGAYNAGARARFLSPFAILLFAMIVLHGVQWMTGGSDGAISHERSVDRALARAQASLDAYAEGEAEDGPDTPGLLQDDSSAARAKLSAEERRERALSTKFFADQAVKAWDPAPSPQEGVAGWRGTIARAASAVPVLFPLIGWLLIPALLPVTRLLLPGSSKAGSLERAHFLAFTLAFGALVIAAGTALVGAGMPVSLAIAAAGILMFAHTSVHVRGAFDLSWPGSAARSAALIGAGIAVLGVIGTGLSISGILG